MTILLFSDKNYESQSIECIKSFQNKVSNDIKIVYYTINFKCDIKLKNVIFHEYIPNKNFYKLNFYKPELCLLTTQLYNDTHYIYMDVDFMISKRLDFKKLEHDEEYPLASYGPVEYPCIYEYIGGPVYTESSLMKYFNVSARTMRYVWNCFFVFNNKCIDFLEEWKSMCENEYLLIQKEKIFPSQDETPFNICLWKRNATKNLGHAFLNTISLSKVKFVEENKLINFSFGESVDCNHYDWESIHTSDEILGYHAFKNVDDMRECAEYLASPLNKNCIVVDCYVNNVEKLEILQKNIASLKELHMDIILVSHSILPKHVIESVEYYIYDKDNTFNEINFYTYYVHYTTKYDIVLTTHPTDGIKSHEYCIVKSIRNAMYLTESLGYDKCIFTEFDNLYTSDDINKMLKLLYNLYKYPDKKAVFFEEGEFCETIFFISNPSFMLKMIDSYFPNSIEEYNSTFSTKHPYGLELFFSKMISNYKDKIKIIDQRFHSFFTNSHTLNLSRVNSISSHIVSDKQNFYLCVKSLDKILYDVDLYEGDIFVERTTLFSDIVIVKKIDDISKYKKFQLLFYSHNNPSVISKQIEIDFDPTKLEFYSSRGTVTFK